jgi:pimeloyl-ACP methyl ester carboxylesterase
MLEELLPGAVGQAIKDADTFFGVELPGLTEWAFGPEQAAAIHCPVLSVLGTDTQPVLVETAKFLRSSLPHVEESLIAGAGHLLQVQRPQPVARAMAEFLASHSIIRG